MFKKTSLYKRILISASSGCIKAGENSTDHLHSLPDRHHLSAPLRSHSELSSSESASDRNASVRFDFDVTDFFAFGSPLGILLAYRKIQVGDFCFDLGSFLLSKFPSLGKARITNLDLNSIQIFSSTIHLSRELKHSNWLKKVT